MGVSNFDAIGGTAGERNASQARYRYSNFRSNPIYTDQAGGTASALDAGINILQVGDVPFQVRLEQAVTASPVFSTANTGMLINVDDTDNEGLEISLGRLQSDGSTVWTNSPGAFTVGTDEAFIRVRLSIGDVSDADQIAVGFSVGAYPAAGTIETYTDLFCLNVDNGNVNIETRLNSGTAAATDTTDDVADAGTVTLECRVDANGNCRAFIDGADPSTNVTNFTFDSGDVIHAFYSQLNDAAGDPTVTLIEWESGVWANRGIDAITDLRDYG
jgi:hypothetical protein